MKKPRRNSGIRSFLEPYIASGNEKAIEEARRAYTRAYKASWRNKQRKSTVQFTISYTPAEAERINEGAQAARRSKTAFIKATSLLYESQQYLVPNQRAVAEIRELLLMNYSYLKGLLGQRLAFTADALKLLERINDLEQKVLSCLQYPKTVFQLIDELMDDDAGRQKLAEHFKKYSS